MDIRLVVEYPEDNSNNNDDDFFTANEAPNNDSSDSEGDTSNSNNEEDINYENTNNLDDIINPQPARNHSYLPTAQPLYPEEWCPAGKHRSQLCRKNDSGGMSTLEVKEEEVDDVAANASNVHEGNRVSLDNTSIDTSYYHYDIPPPPSLQSHNVSNSNSNTLAVMEIEDVVLFPGSVLPLRLSDRRWVNYLRNLINDARGLYGLHSSSIGGIGEVRIVILPKSDTTRRTRRQPREGGGRTGRWQVELIRRGVTGVSRRFRRRMLRESEEAETSNEAAEEDIDENRQEEHNEHNHESEQSDEEENEDDIFHPSDRPLSTIPCDGDPLVGRIGTLATITFTHEDTAASANIDQAVAVEDTTTSSRVWHNRGDELVLTVLGTKRVRLTRSMRDKKRDQSTSVPLYDVEEIRDESTIPPPIWMLQSPGIRSRVTTRAFIESNVSKEQKEEGDKSEEDMVGITDYDNKALQNLASRTSTPVLAYQIVWPWKLCRKICRLIQGTEEFKGLLDIMQSAAGLCFDSSSNTEIQKIPFQVVDPSAFSDWLASNVPLSYNERIDMLEMICTIDRLRFILKKLEKSKKEQSSIKCKHCGATISQMRQIFSVGGSEGTAGAYVNCHGIVHHTMTLRDIEAQSVICIGQPETKDSWFPGYSWQIAYCSVCHDHLGWKFRKVGQRSDENNYVDRPTSFWGFSSVTTDERDVQPRRVQFQSRDD